MQLIQNNTNFRIDFLSNLRDFFVGNAIFYIYY